MSAAEVFTARELAEKLEAAASRRDELHRRLGVAWDALRMIAKGAEEASQIATRAMREIKEGG